MPQRLVRNIFDQYHQAENRLTHALVHVLANDGALTKKFVQFATGHNVPAGIDLSVSCQLLPGEPIALVEEEDYAERRGLPDAWIYDAESGFAVVIECKLTSPLTKDQLLRHLRTSRSRGFPDAYLLVITTDEVVPRAVSTLSGERASFRGWPAIFEFFKGHDTRLAHEFTSYLGIMEGQLMAQGHHVPPLTKFTGVPFTRDHPFNEPEARVVLRALMRDVRPRLAQSRVLPPIDSNVRRDSLSGAWDVVGFAFASGANFTAVPHITVDLAPEGTWIQLTLPNAAHPKYWRRVREASQDQLAEVFARVNERIKPIAREVRHGIREPRLVLDLLQRHFYTRRDAVHDAEMFFDIEALGFDADPLGASVKQVPAWLTAIHALLGQSGRANFQLELQARFPLLDGSVCHQTSFVDVLVQSAEAFEPFLALLRGDGED